MKLSNIILAIVLTVSATVVHAIPDMWSSGFAMSVTECSENGIVIFCSDCYL